MQQNVLIGTIEPRNCEENNFIVPTKFFSNKFLLQTTRFANIISGQSYCSATFYKTGFSNLIRWVPDSQQQQLCGAATTHQANASSVWKETPPSVSPVCYHYNLFKYTTH